MKFRFLGPQSLYKLGYSWEVWGFLNLFFVVLRLEPRALRVSGKFSTSDLIAKPQRNPAMNLAFKVLQAHSEKHSALRGDYVF